MVFLNNTYIISDCCSVFFKNINLFRSSKRFSLVQNYVRKILIRNLAFFASPIGLQLTYFYSNISATFSCLPI